MRDNESSCGVALCEVRSVCGGDYVLAEQVCNLLDREGEWARRDERKLVVVEVNGLSAVENAKSLVEETGFDDEDAGNCVLAESIISLIADIIEKGAGK